uniref:Single-stranded DNA binding protein n=1 Tax=Titanophycus setchellii TaxID=940129 RepID=A0A1G4NY10_9FLOR|nr:Hypothetical protein ycf41 [Titanophycus setchellii]SCW23581.1 Hypothetical protein ycf41 [Titanophycus setchellii]
MQIYILTIQISTTPKRDIAQNFSTFFVKILNATKGEPYYYMKAVAWGDAGRNIHNLYRKGDYMIIESYIIYKHMIKTNILVVTREHPIFLSP